MKSFHICDEDIGGPQLNIDITKYYDLSASGVLESYRDVCTCINVPEYVQNRTWGINNYGNDLLAYYHPDCLENKWKAQNVPAGIWCVDTGSECMHNYKKTDSVSNTVYKIQSIGPDPNSKYFKTSCKSALQNDVLKLEQKQDKHFSSLATKNDQHYKQTDTLLSEIEAMKNTIAELKLNQENQYKSLIDLIKNLKDDFEIFT